MAEQESKPRVLDGWVMDGLEPGGGALKKVDSVQGPTALTQGIGIVDCDTHLSEAPDLWTSRAPAGLKSKMPYVKHVQGLDLWHIGDDVIGPIGTTVLDPARNKLLGKLSWPTFEQMDPGSWDVKPRLDFMDTFGVQAQICYPNAGGIISGPVLRAHGDDEYAKTVLRIYNEARAEQQAESGNRIFPQAVLPMWDRDALVEEAQRCIEEHKMVGFNLPDRPEQFGIPGYLKDHWAPLFELCNETGAPINFHIASGIDGFEFTWEDFPFETRLAIGSMLFYIGNAATVANFLMSGLFDKYPGLRIVSVESGLGWIPFVLESLEYQFDEMMPNAGLKLQKRPKEYFADHVWACYWFETTGPRDLIEKVGARNVLFETDYPHPTSLYPRVHEHIEETLGDHDVATRERVLRDNAVELYQLPL